jgi:hypothetical protein
MPVPGDRSVHEAASSRLQHPAATESLASHPATARRFVTDFLRESRKPYSGVR